MNDKFNIAFFGSSEFVIPILHSIKQNQGLKLRDVFLEQLNELENIQDNFVNIDPEWLQHKSKLVEQVSKCKELDQTINLTVVLSQPDRENRGKIFSNPVVEYARKSELDVFLPEKINKSKEEFLAKYGANLDLGLVASFGQIISTDILAIPKFGFLNWHPSKLPLYRGPTPMQTALVNGDHTVALSWINMTKQMDAGNVWLQLETELGPEIGFVDMAQKIGDLGANTWTLPLVAKILERFYPESAIIQSVAQVESDVVFCKMLVKEDKIVNPEHQTAQQIYNHWRGMQAFPGTTFVDEYFREEVKIVDCLFDLEMQTLDKSMEIQKFGNWVQIRSGKQIKTYLICAGDSLLEVRKIMRSGGKQLDFSGFLFS
jgi:methionyl-tRNA formyltransferase